MKLRELEPYFLKYLGDGSSQRIDDIKEADGVIFLCPKCFETNKGRIGTHCIICWFVGRVGDDVVPKPGRWNPSGTGYDDLTFVPPGNVSVLLTSGCGWHGLIENGETRTV